MKFLQQYIEDLLIFSGLAVMVGATFFINILAGFYATGITLFGLGVYFARFPPKEVKKYAIPAKRKGSGTD